MSAQVAILLATYNGEKFLVEQLESIHKQTHSNWIIYASDDGSKDSTLQILNAYMARWGKNKFILLHGLGRGHAHNFLSLVEASLGRHDYYAFSDQDDVWMPDKLERAISILSHSDTPLNLYCSRTAYIDNFRNHIGSSTIFKKPLSFKNALVQSIAGGNTMVFSKEASNLFEHITNYDLVVSHDWLLYILVTGVGGKVYYDRYESVLYRQHSFSLVGQNKTFTAKIKRLKMLLMGRYRIWIGRNLSIVQLIFPKLTDNNQKTFNYILRARDFGLIARTIAFIRSGVYRQNLIGNIALFIAVVIRKF